MSEISVVPYGDRAALIELAVPAEVTGLRASLLARAAAGVLSVRPAARTVLVEFDPALTDLATLAELANSCLQTAGMDHTGQGIDAGEPALIEVRYDAPDLAMVAKAAELTIEQLVRHHVDAEYTVRFCGFSPGFGYLTGLHPKLRQPRLASPRPSVPAGSVAIAGEFTGIYPRSSPGGWRLIGHTDATLFELDRDPPALLWPGRQVRFVPR